MVIMTIIISIDFYRMREEGEGGSAPHPPLTDDVT